MGFLEVFKWPVYKVNYTYKSYKQQHLQFYPPPDLSNITGKTALIPAHEEPKFGGANICAAQAGSARPILVRLPSVRPIHAIIEDASDCISSADSTVETPDVGTASDVCNDAGLFAPCEIRIKAGRVEVNKFEMNRSNAVRSKLFVSKLSAPMLRPKFQHTDRPFSYMLPTDSLLYVEATSTQPQLKRAGAIRRKNPRRPTTDAKL